MYVNAIREVLRYDALKHFSVIQERELFQKLLSQL